MPDFLLAPFASAGAIDPRVVLLRLVMAMAFGGAVAFIYRRTRPAADTVTSFSVTLVLLTILIAMVTQVIGDNVARAFSLVGALSIVRFRTVVRDTQDTAYVIFAVVVGMAIGASDPWVALAGLGVVGCAAAIMRARPSPPATAQLPYLLQIRLGLGHDPDSILGAAFDEHARQRRLVSLATARQGTSMDVSYRAALNAEHSAGALVKALNRVEGVQSVSLQRVDEDA